MFEIISISVIAIAIAIGSIVWIIKNKSPQTTDPKELPEAKEQPQITDPLKMIDLRPDLGRTDYETVFLSYPNYKLTAIINSSYRNTFEKQYASAELERRKRVPFSIPEGVDISALLPYSTYANEALWVLFKGSSPAQQQAINFIFKCRGKIE